MFFKFGGRKYDLFFYSQWVKIFISLFFNYQIIFKLLFIKQIYEMLISKLTIYNILRKIITNCIDFPLLIFTLHKIYK